MLCMEFTWCPPFYFATLKLRKNTYSKTALQGYASYKTHSDKLKVRNDIAMMVMVCSILFELIGELLHYSLGTRHWEPG